MHFCPDNISDPCFEMAKIKCYSIFNYIYYLIAVRQYFTTAIILADQIMWYDYYNAIILECVWYIELLHNTKLHMYNLLLNFISNLQGISKLVASHQWNLIFYKFLQYIVVVSQGHFVIQRYISLHVHRILIDKKRKIHNNVCIEMKTKNRYMFTKTDRFVAIILIFDQNYCHKTICLSLHIPVFTKRSACL